MGCWAGGVNAPLAAGRPTAADATDVDETRADLPDAAWAAALAGFPLMTAHRLRVMLRHLTPRQAFDVAAGREPPPAPIDRILLDRDLARRWARAALDRPPVAVWQVCAQLGVGVSVLGDAAYPWSLALDRAAPAVLFHRGSLGRARAPPGGDRRHAQRDLARPHHGRQVRGRARRAGRRRRVRAGARRRRRRSSRRARRAGRPARRRRRLGARRPLSARARRRVGRGRRSWPTALRIAARHRARGAPVPAAQPDPGGAQRGVGRRRVARRAAAA